MLSGNKLGKILISVSPFVLTIAVSILFYFILTPEELIAFVGVDNAYVLMFATALIGGLTTFNMVPYYSVLFILASAGLPPAGIGLASALGVMVGDSYSYFIGRQGGIVFPERMRRPFEYIRAITAEHPWRFRVICVVYGSFSPLSNDFITIPSGIARIPYMRVIIPLAFGNIVFNVTFAYVCVYAYAIVRAWVA